MIPKIYVYDESTGKTLYRAERGHSVECYGYIHVITSYGESLVCQCQRYTLSELLSGDSN
jgi:hypothetical protein